jgi:hypothetical protein
LGTVTPVGVEITEHLPRGFYGEIVELGVDVAWSDKPLLLGTPCDSEQVQALVASERASCPEIGSSTVSWC